VLSGSVTKVTPLSAQTFFIASSLTLPRVANMVLIPASINFCGPVQLYLEDVFTVPANHAGIPALSVPSGTVSEDGKELPLGVQFMGPHLSEKRLCAIGKRFLGESN
jgi:Asp-tRNA(Asn)/Glu-tRNA(Gln) amidotransferase A subunit family amidase